MARTDHGSEPKNTLEIFSSAVHKITPTVKTVLQPVSDEDHLSIKDKLQERAKPKPNKTFHGLTPMVLV